MAQTYPIDIRVDPAQASAGSRQIKRELRGIQTEGSKTRGLLLGIFGGAAITAGIRRSTGLLAAFSQEMSTVRAVSRATDSEFNALRASAERLGRTTRFSATQAAEGMTFLARAGFDANQVLETIEGTLQLAQAGGLGLGRAADIASNALQGFQLDVEETGRVVDVLALAANTSNTSVTQLGDALSFAAPIASGLGVSIEETTAAIGALSNAGLQGSRAGTGLNRVMAELESPSSAALDVLTRLGLTQDDVRITSVGLTGAIKALADAGVTTGQALELFGQRGGPAFDVLSKAIPDVQQMTGELLNAAGTAERVADTMDDNLNGAILAVRSSIEGFIIAMGNAGATDALVVLAQSMATGFRFAADNAEILTLALGVLALRGIGGLTASFVLSNAAIKSQIVGLLALQATAGTTKAVLFATATAARGLAASMLAFAAANPVLLGLSAIAAGFFLLRKEAVEVVDHVGNAEAALVKYTRTTSALEGDQSLLTEKVKDFKTAMEDLGPTAQDAARLEIDAIEQRIKANQALLKSYAETIAAQLESAKASRTNGFALAEAAGIATTQRETFTNTNAFSPSLGQTRTRTVQRSGEDIERIFQTELDGLRELASQEGALTRVQSARYAKLSQLNAQRLEEGQRIFKLETALERINSGESIELDKPGGGDGSGNGGSSRATDFQTAFAELQSLTAAIGQNRAAQERASGVLEFARQNELKLTEAQKARVNEELRLQQVANDNEAQKQRILDIEKETEVMGLSGREAEIRIALYTAERESLLGLSAGQADRIRSLLEEQQALKDSLIIGDRLDALEQEAFLLTKLGTEARVWSEVLRLQNQLERDLTETEISWIRQATELNEELERRNRIMRDAVNPADQAKKDMASLIALYREGKITLEQYNRELLNNSLANDVLALDSTLAASGQDVGLSNFERQRRDSEQQLRGQEGGGQDDGSGQSLFGLSAEQLGTGDQHEQIRQETQDRLELIRQAREAELLTEEEFAERKQAILDKSIADQRTSMLSGLQLQLSSAESLFGSLTEIAANTAGEQSGIYKAMFAVEKAIAIARSIVAIQTGIAQASALPFPANLGAIASVAAATASIVSNIQAVRLQFRDGGVPMPGPGLLGGTGGPREDSNIIAVSRGEGILNAEATRKNFGLFNALNEDPDFLRKQGFFRDGGVPLPPANSGRSSAPRGMGRNVMQIDVGGIRVDIKGGGENSREQGRQAGEEAGRAFIRTVLAEELLPQGTLDRAING